MLVVFVCLHGAGRSRVAAALFNSVAPPGWRAASAGLEPQPAASPHPLAMLEGMPAAQWLDVTPPRAIQDVTADVTVAIDCDTPADRRWDLKHEWPDPGVVQELRDLTDDFARSL